MDPLAIPTTAWKIIIITVAFVLILSVSGAVEREKRERQLLNVAASCRADVIWAIEEAAAKKYQFMESTVNCPKDKGRSIAIHFYESTDDITVAKALQDQTGMQCTSLTERLPAYEQQLVRSAVREHFSSIFCDKPNLQLTTRYLLQLAKAAATKSPQLPKRPLLDQAVIDWIDGQITAQLTKKCQNAANASPVSKLIVKGEDKADFASIRIACENNSKVKLFANDLANQYGSENGLGAWKEEITTAFKKVFCGSEIDLNTARTQADLKKRMESALK